jgi:hypothetical protein
MIGGVIRNQKVQSAGKIGTPHKPSINALAHQWNSRQPLRT